MLYYILFTIICSIDIGEVLHANINNGDYNRIEIIRVESDEYIHSSEILNMGFEYLAKIKYSSNIDDMIYIGINPSVNYKNTQWEKHKIYQRVAINSKVYSVIEHILYDKYVYSIIINTTVYFCNKYEILIKAVNGSRKKVNKYNYNADVLQDIAAEHSYDKIVITKSNTAIREYENNNNAGIYPKISALFIRSEGETRRVRHVNIYASKEIAEAVYDKHFSALEKTRETLTNNGKKMDVWYEDMDQDGQIIQYTICSRGHVLTIPDKKGHREDIK